MHRFLVIIRALNHANIWVIARLMFFLNHLRLSLVRIGCRFSMTALLTDCFEDLILSTYLGNLIFHLSQLIIVKDYWRTKSPLWWSFTCANDSKVCMLTVVYWWLGYQISKTYSKLENVVVRVWLNVMAFFVVNPTCRACPFNNY